MTDGMLEAGDFGELDGFGEPGEFDVFVSHTWVGDDFAASKRIVQALRDAKLRVWFDETQVDEFSSITQAVQRGLAHSKVLLAYYSKTYPTRRACQWELTAAYLAACAAGDARERVLLVNPEAGSEHIHPIELRDAKYRTAVAEGDAAALAGLAAAVKTRVGRIPNALGKIHPLEAPEWRGMKAVGSTRFVGRADKLWAIHSMLHRADVALVSGAAAGHGVGQVSGMGGVGKSLLAEEYALRFGAAYPCGIFWLRAYGNDDAKEALTAEAREAARLDQIRGFAREVGLAVEGMSPEAIEAGLGKALTERQGAYLWVVDDLPSGLERVEWERWIAPGGRGRTLMTTRSREYGAMAGSLDLSVMTKEEGYQLLTSQRKPADAREEEAARSLAAEMGYHALALAVAASTLKNWAGKRPFAGFLAQVKERDEDAMELAVEMAEALPNGHEKSIAKTILSSVRLLGEDGKDFLRLAAMLAVAPISGELLAKVLERADGLTEMKAQRKASVAFQQVTSTALAEIAGEEKDARAVHTLVSRAMRFAEKEMPERSEALRSAAVVTLREAIAEKAEDPREHKAIEAEVGHARQLVVEAWTEEDAYLLGWLGRYDSERGACPAALGLLEKQMGLLTAQLGPEHPDTLTSMNNLAEEYHALGEPDKARGMHEEVLEIQRKVLGPEHPNTLTSINNLAGTYRVLGEPGKAQGMHEEALKIQRKVLGPEHPDTLTSMNNLAATYRVLGELDKAWGMHEEVLEIRRKVLGPEHPDTLTSMNNLADTIHALGELDKARGMHEEVLEIQRKMLGLEHPNTSLSAWNLYLCLERDAAQRVLEEDLLWLLERDPAMLGSMQREIRADVERIVRGE